MLGFTAPCDAFQAWFSLVQAWFRLGSVGFSAAGAKDRWQTSAISFGLHLGSLLVQAPRRTALTTDLLQVTAFYTGCETDPKFRNRGKVYF